MRTKSKIQTTGKHLFLDVFVPVFADLKGRLESCKHFLNFINELSNLFSNSITCLICDGETLVSYPSLIIYTFSFYFKFLLNSICLWDSSLHIFSSFSLTVLVIHIILFLILFNTMSLKKYLSIFSNFSKFLFTFSWFITLAFLHNIPNGQYRQSHF